MNPAFLVVKKFTMEIEREMFLLGVSSYPKFPFSLSSPFAGWQSLLTHLPQHPH
jgi:hypothetical protein